VRISDAGPDSEAISDAAPGDNVSMQRRGADFKKQGRPPHDEETKQLEFSRAERRKGDALESPYDSKVDRSVCFVNAGPTSHWPT
jgi:hypothetical protein